MPQVYNTYRFRNKDPIIDKLRTIKQDFKESYGQASLKSGVSETTLRNWFEGKTRRPQFASIMAFVRGHGHDLRIVKLRKK